MLSDNNAGTDEGTQAGTTAGDMAGTDAGTQAGTQAGIEAGIMGVDGDDDGSLAQFDCNERDEFIYPGAVDTCDEIDNDCDLLIDEGVLNACGYCGIVPNEVCDNPPCHDSSTGCPELQFHCSC